MRDFVTLSQDRVTWWIWRCHIDMSTPDQALYDYLMPSINDYDAAIYTLRDHVPQGLTVPVREIAPTIDPLAPKNMRLSSEDAAYIVRQFGVDIERPLLLQVSRFDPWKDPLGVVDVYRTVTAKYPGTQLALIGSMASGDLEGWDYLEKVIEYVGGDVGGIPLQIEDSLTGYLVKSAAECAERCLEMLADPEKHRRMALLGKEHARREFHTPRLRRDDLRLFSDLRASKIRG